MKPVSLILIFTLPVLALPAAESSAASATPALDLDALVASVVAHHPEVAFYAAELDAAKAARRTAVARSDPELSVDAGRKRVRSATRTLEGEGIAWSVSLAQTFEWPGRLALRRSIANREVELAELGLARFRAALAARARVLAFGLHAARQEAAVTAEVAARYQGLREVFLARDPAGLTAQLETRVIEAQEIALKRRATDAAIAAHAALVELNQLRGAPPEADLALAPVRLTFNAAPAADVLLAAARENYFEFRAKKLELEQQGLVVSLARNERHPAVTVRPFYSQEKAGDRETTAGVGLSLPLPLTDRSRANVDTAEARRRQAEAAVGVAARELERTLLAAAHAFAARAAALAEWQPDSVARFRESAALADRHYRLGAVPLATYVELQTAYLEAVAALLATEREALAAGQQLQLLTGLDLKTVEVRP